MGLRLLESVLDDIERGELVMRPQPADLATWEPSFTGAPRLFRPELLQLGELHVLAPLSNSKRKRTLSPVSSSTAVAS